VLFVLVERLANRRRAHEQPPEPVPTEPEATR